MLTTFKTKYSVYGILGAAIWTFFVGRLFCYRVYAWAQICGWNWLMVIALDKKGKKQNRPKNYYRWAYPKGEMSQIM